MPWFRERRRFLSAAAVGGKRRTPDPDPAPADGPADGSEEPWVVREVSANGRGEAAPVAPRPPVEGWSAPAAETEPRRPAPVGRDEAARGPAGRSRLTGVDAARALAILGMVAVHVGPTNGEGVLGRLYTLPHGRASILFMLIAGVGISLLASSRSRTPAETRLTLLWRAALLLPVGLLLQELDHGARVILQDYALLFVLAVGMVRLSDRWILGLAGGSALLGPLLYVRGRIQAPESYAREGIAISDAPGEILHGLVLSGPYPLVTWAAPFLLGMWIGRRDLRAPRLRVGLMLGGGAVAAAATALSRYLTGALGVDGSSVGWSHLVTSGPHSQMPLWIIGGTGVAALVLGASLAVLDRVDRPLRPLVAAGQLALTIYVGHLVALHLAPETLQSDALGPAVALVAAFAAAILVFSSLWRMAFRKGPLEMALRPPWRPAPRPGREPPPGGT